MDFLLHIIVIINITVPISMGYTLLFGKGKVMHFGPIGVSLAAAYSLFLTFDHTGSYLAAIAVGLAVVTLLSIVFTWLSLRLEPDGFGVMSIALHLMVLAVVLNWTSVTGGAIGIANIPRLPFLSTLPAFALFSGVVAMLWIALFVAVDRSVLGRSLAALGESETHAMALGVRRGLVYFIAFLLIGLASLSDNVFYPQYIHLLHSTDYLFPTFIILLMIVVAGKPGSILGSVLSCALLVSLKEGIRFLPIPSEHVGPIRLLLFGVILLAAVWWRRDVLFPKRRTI